MNADEQTQIKQMIIEIKACIEQLNKELEGNVSEEYEKIIKLAGDLNASITQR